MNKPLYLGDYQSFGDFDRACLRSILARLDVPTPTIVEVGSWLGTGSTQLLIDHIRRHGGRLHCIDTWEGSPGVERHVEMLATYDVFGSFRENVKRAGGAGCVEEHRMPSADAASAFADGSVDLVFIDADHKFDTVRADLLAWQPKVRPGGIVCGHDCETRVTPQNRQMLLQARDQDHVQGQAPFAVWHAGVILAVDEVFNGSARLWAEEIVTLPDGRRGSGTLWHVRIPTA